MVCASWSTGRCARNVTKRAPRTAPNAPASCSARRWPSNWWPTSRWAACFPAGSTPAPSVPSRWPRWMATRGACRPSPWTSPAKAAASSRRPGKAAGTNPMRSWRRTSSVRRTVPCWSPRKRCWNRTRRCSRPATCPAGASWTPRSTCCSARSASTPRWHCRASRPTRCSAATRSSTTRAPSHTTASPGWPARAGPGNCCGGRSPNGWRRRNTSGRATARPSPKCRGWMARMPPSDASARSPTWR